MTEKLLLELTVILLGCLLALLAWVFRQHATQHDELKRELTEVKEQRIECTAAFATKGAMSRAHERIDEQEMKLDSLTTRVIILEERSELRR